MALAHKSLHPLSHADRKRGDTGGGGGGGGAADTPSSAEAGSTPTAAATAFAAGIADSAVGSGSSGGPPNKNKTTTAKLYRIPATKQTESVFNPEELFAVDYCDVEQYVSAFLYFSFQ
jgi:hypothetical protein